MKSYRKYLFAIVGWTAFFFAVIWMMGNVMPIVEKELASISHNLATAFASTISTKHITSRYAGATTTVKVLIVPGHDNQNSGTVFEGKREADLVLAIAKELESELAKDQKLQLAVTRDFNSGDYKPAFANYFKEQKSSIEYFIQSKRSQMVSFLKRGEVKRNVTIDHNPAVSNVVLRLYGINKWSNENDVDILLHLHLNDDPTRNRTKGQKGKFEGFSIYVPESQYGNAEASYDLASYVAKSLSTHSSTSTNPLEKAGIIEAQELIALGSNGSQNGASVLIEYGYIYESRFMNDELWPAEAARLGQLTAEALRAYVGAR